jgi:hypothetical protein
MATWDQGEADTTESHLYCANHPTVETYLRCGKCEKPICAKCRVSTPVGFRCFDCARLQVLPTYAVKSEYYVKSALLGGSIAIVLGIVMGVLPSFEFWAALALGIAVPEAVARGANQKRGPGLQMVGIGALVLGFVTSRVVMEVFDTGLFYRFAYQPPDLLGDLPFYITQYTVIWFALATWFTLRRLQ